MSHVITQSESTSEASTDATSDAAPTTVRAGAFGNARALSCRECGHLVELGPHYACPECFGPLEIAYDFPAVTRAEIEAGPRNIWRYKALLPVPSDIEESPNTEPGFTRLLAARNLGAELGIDRLWVKDDSTNPTNSFKDRVVACALSAARELHAKVFACPSTGNLANAVAAAGARAGIKTVVFIPSNLEKPKQVNSAVYTDSLVAVDGTYDDVNKLASEIAGEEEGWAFVNVNVRPYYAEGSKTLGYEIAEQLGWRLPDQVVIPVASGSQLTKVDKAFRELVALGLVEDKPYRVYGAQATGCSPVSVAYKAGTHRPGAEDFGRGLGPGRCGCDHRTVVRRIQGDRHLRDSARACSSLAGPERPRSTSTLGHGGMSPTDCDILLGRHVLGVAARLPPSTSPA